MDKLSAMEVFVRVVESGSFVRAAERLGMSTTAVSRQLADLEAQLGARLLQRTTRRLHLTDAGRGYHARCAQILADVEEADASVRTDTLRPRGVLRLSAPVSFGLKHLTALLPAYLAAYPEVTLDVDMSDRQVDLVEEGFDVALRIAMRLPPTLVARRIAAIHVVPCASPAYLAREGEPARPEDLARHRCLVYTHAAEPGIWTFGDEARVSVDGPLKSNNGDLLRAAALAGEGIICEPSFLLGDDLAAGRLMPLLRGEPTPPLALYAVYPSRRHLSAKVRTFVDFLIGRIGDPPPWDAWMEMAEPRRSGPEGF
ncbi:LysR family transcriptional regulator [Paludibacterium paludis]|uniref:Transcriptional regulator n=1 Tax=Paludibacterium paludis TaxID=1225769 RepID=A0A918P5X5_9NEIS|nr:LysR family transcriptional regulator [Paludibacterium paludis]GGY28269.1 transcriptional regulator [Paludibacterium paludis]